jgi:putative hydrolase of the HAD superfamily
MIKAVIFDFDGLMVDTETPCYHAFAKVYQEYGFELPLPLYAKCVGTSYDEFNPYTYLSECMGESFDLALITSKFQSNYSALLADAVLRPGVEDYLKTAKETGQRIGLASSSKFSWIEPYLLRFGLVSYFDSICTGDQVQKVKPDPELYLRSLDNLKVTGPETISFEDSLNGFHAARSAGLHCVIVPNELTRTFDFEAYDLLIPSMDTMPLQEVVRIMNGEKGYESSVS